MGGKINHENDIWAQNLTFWLVHIKSCASACVSRLGRERKYCRLSTQKKVFPKWLFRGNSKWGYLKGLTLRQGYDSTIWRLKTLTDIKCAIRTISKGSDEIFVPPQASRLRLTETDFSWEPSTSSWINSASLDWEPVLLTFFLSLRESIIGGSRIGLQFLGFVNENQTNLID